MLDKRRFNDNLLYHDMPQEDQYEWFGYTRQKFLHNIDTFYYSVKFRNDFRVAPLVGAWIEITNLKILFGSTMVAPLVGVRIETMLQFYLNWEGNVDPILCELFYFLLSYLSFDLCF